MQSLFDEETGGHRRQHHGNHERDAQGNGDGDGQSANELPGCPAERKQREKGGNDGERGGEHRDRHFRRAPPAGL